MMNDQEIDKVWIDIRCETNSTQTFVEEIRAFAHTLQEMYAFKMNKLDSENLVLMQESDELKAENARLREHLERIYFMSDCDYESKSTIRRMCEEALKGSR
jgi:hypothetical protein